jgi:hypothetical protein
MNPVEYKTAFNSLRCTSTSRLQYIDSREAEQHDGILDDEGILSKIPSIVSADFRYRVVSLILLQLSLCEDAGHAQVPTTISTPPHDKAPFLAMYAQ